jgi:hypothetical protein
MNAHISVGYYNKAVTGNRWRVTGKTLLLVTHDLSLVTVFTLAFASFSLYHGTLHAFVRSLCA